MRLGHYEPNWLGEPEFVPAPPPEFDSTIVDDPSPWHLCATCHTLRVAKSGDSCKLCAHFLAPTASLTPKEQ